MADDAPQAIEAICDLIATECLPEAIRLCEDLLRRSQNHYIASILKALSLAAAGSIHDAIAHYEEALALAPESLPAYIGIAAILAREGWFSSAAVVLENARTTAHFTPTTQRQLHALHTLFVEAARTSRETSA